VVEDCNHHERYRHCRLLLPIVDDKADVVVDDDVVDTTGYSLIIVESGDQCWNCVNNVERN
jgi:hypothetical protein